MSTINDEIAARAQRADKWADWLVDAVAGATQDRRYLRHEDEEDKIATEAIYLNGQKALIQHSHDEVIRELRALTKWTCGYCRDEWPYHQTSELHMHASEGTRWCSAVEIHRRIAELEGQR